MNAVVVNNRRKVFEVTFGSRLLPFPYARCNPRPDREDRVDLVQVDPEIGREGFTYRLESGREGTVHSEQVLDYNRDPAYLRQMLLYRLTVEARQRIEASPLSKREIIRLMRTSPAQLYRLLDPTNQRKSLNRMLDLLAVLDCRVDLVVHTRDEEQGMRTRPPDRGSGRG